MKRPRALLVMSCSARKLGAVAPAVKLYDGPAFRVLRRHEREHGGLPCDVFILSARHGIIAAETEIETYNLRLTAAAAVAMRERVAAALRAHVGHAPYTRCFIFGGAAYRAALAPFEAWRPRSLRDFTTASGGIGVQLGQLKRWLEERRREN